jgi:CDP-glucose 4,6-dehydratase
MTLLLERMGVEVVGYSLPPTETSLYSRLNRVGQVKEVFHDIRDKKNLNKFLQQTKPRYVIHMAAQPLVLESYKNPGETFEVNVMGTVNLIEAAFQTDSVQVIGVVTTDKVYKNDATGKNFIESDPLEGKDPYSASKVATESVVSSWSNIQKISGGPKLISLRAGNVIGGGDFAENRIMPDLIRSLISGEVVEIRNPKSTRPWQHVLDPLIGYLVAIIQALNSGKENAFNFGPNENSLTVEELVKIVERNFPDKFKIENNYDQESKEIESKLLGLDSSLSRMILDWHPAWSQEESIISTINWWVDVIAERISVSEKCLSDINHLLDFHDIELE